MPRYSKLPRRKEGRRVSNRRRILSWTAYFSILLFFVVCLCWLRGILLPFIIALLIGYILEPLVTRAHGWGIARWIGVISVYVLLVGLIALFLRFLVPIINNESGKLFSKFNVVVAQTPDFYAKLEGGVGDLIDRIQGREPEAESPSEAMGPMRDDDWGFGPPVHKIPSVSPPMLSTVEAVGFGSPDESLTEAGVPEQPRLSAVILEGGKAAMAPQKGRKNTLTIEQVKPGVFGVNLGKATVEVRKVGEGAYAVAARDEPMEASRFSDLKNRVLSSMRLGLQQFSTSLLGGFFTFFQGLVSGIMNALVGLVVVFLVGAFVMIDSPRIKLGFRNNVPVAWRNGFDELMARLNDGLSGVVRGQLIICLVNGVLSTIGFLIFIPEYAVVLGILAAVMSLVPIFGTIISSVPAILVALTISFGHAVGVLGWILGIHFVEAYILNPNIIGRQARIHPIVVIFVLVAGESLYGMKGILLAVPATSVVQSIIQFGYSRIKGDVTQ